MRKLQLLNTTHNFLTKFLIEKISPSYILTCLTHDVKLKRILGVDTTPFDNWSWSMMSTTWSPEFVWKLFLLRKSQIRRVIKVMLSSLFPFCQGLSLVQVPTLYCIRRLRFQGDIWWCMSPPSTKHICRKRSVYEELVNYVF